MPGSVQEALDLQNNPQAAANHAGVDQISYWQEIKFTRYVRLVLPLDGYVFWVNAGLIERGPQTYGNANFNTFNYNSNALGIPLNVSDPIGHFIIGQSGIGQGPISKMVKGSLHYETDALQEEDETYQKNRVIFTAQEPAQVPFTQIDPSEMWIGEFEGIRFAFTARSRFYQQAGLWHYVADAIYPDMDPQIIDDVSKIDTNAQIVSNSLPIWLSFNSMQVPDWMYFAPTVKLYPSFLAPENIRPPFATVHITPETTEAIASAPYLGRTMSHYQLVQEEVRITFWGCNNRIIMDFMEFVNAFSENYQGFGILNMPVPRDEKRIQSDISVIAQKKTVEWKICYHQEAARDIARYLIKTVVPNIIIS